MATLIELLNQFNENTIMRDHTDSLPSQKTIKELKSRFDIINDRNTSYYLSTTKYNYGKTIKKSVCCEYGVVFSEV